MKKQKTIKLKHKVEKIFPFGSVIVPIVPKSKSKTIEISEATLYFKKKLSKKKKYKIMESILNKYPIQAIFFREVMKL